MTENFIKNAIKIINLKYQYPHYHVGEIKFNDNIRKSKNEFNILSEYVTQEQKTISHVT